MILPFIAFWSLSAGLTASSAMSDSQVQSELSRLVGHTTTRTEAGYRIVDIAGQGEPIVGCIRQVDRLLFLQAESGDRLRLSGPLAVPRIAGPNYKVWVLGTIGRDSSIEVTRLGILAQPPRASCNHTGNLL